MERKQAVALIVLCVSMLLVFTGCPQVSFEYNQADDIVLAQVDWDDQLSFEQIFNSVDADVRRVGIGYLINDSVLHSVDWGIEDQSSQLIELRSIREAIYYPDHLRIVPVAELENGKTVLGNMSLWSGTIAGRLLGTNGFSQNGLHWEVSVPFKPVSTPVESQTWNWPGYKVQAIIGNDVGVWVMGSFYAAGGRHGFIQAFTRSHTGGLNRVDDWFVDGLFQYCSPLMLSNEKLYAVHGNSISGGRTILEFDVQQPQYLLDPRAVVELSAGVEDMAISEGILWITSLGSGFRSVDLGSGQVLASMPIYSRGIAIAENIAYLCAHNDGVLVFDVSDPSNPSEITRIDDEGIWAVDVVFGPEKTAYVLWGNGHLVSYDVSDLSSPRKLGSYDHVGNCFDKRIQATDWFVVLNLNNVDSMNHYAGVEVIDVVDPSHPVLVSSDYRLHNDVNCFMIGSKLYGRKFQEFKVWDLLE